MALTDIIEPGDAMVGILEVNEPMTGALKDILAKDEGGAMMETPRTGIPASRLIGGR